MLVGHLAVGLAAKRDLDDLKDLKREDLTLVRIHGTPSRPRRVTLDGLVEL